VYPLEGEGKREGRRREGGGEMKLKCIHQPLVIDEYILCYSNIEVDKEEVRIETLFL